MFSCTLHYIVEQYGVVMVTVCTHVFYLDSAYLPSPWSPALEEGPPDQWSRLRCQEIPDCLL